MVEEGDAFRRGSRRQRVNRVQDNWRTTINFNELPMGDDPYKDMPVQDRGPRPEQPEINYGDDECEAPEVPICPPPEECSAVMQQEDGTCKKIMENY